MFSKPNKIVNNSRGVTLVEIMMALLIIGLVMAPLVKALYNGIRGASKFGDSNKGIQLAQELMEEIKQKKWDESTPLGGGAATYYTNVANLGPETNANYNTTAGPKPSLRGIDGVHLENTIMPPAAAWDGKSNWNDIDDYNGYTERPPRDINNIAIFNQTDFTRSVTVEYVSIPTANPPAVNKVQTSAVPTDYKLVTVSVTWTGNKAPVVLKTVLANIKKY